MTNAIQKIPYLPFQKNAIRECLKRKKVLINYPAGSGKSLIALGTANKVEAKRVLIICPSFLRLKWEYEIEKWFSNKLIKIIYNLLDMGNLGNLKNVYAIVGYSFFEERDNYLKKKAYKLPLRVKILKNQQWDLIICDESHYLRLWESNRTRNVVKGTLRMRDRLMFLSATPLVTSAADLHPTYAIMRPGVFGNFRQFADKYANSAPDHFSPRGIRYWGINKINAQELRELSSNFVLTEKKKVILKELPEKQIIDIPLEVKKLKTFDESLEEMLDRLTDEDDEEVKTEREKVGLAKVEGVLDLLKTIPRNEPVVIFAHHRKVLKALAEGLKEQGFKPRILMGGMTEKKRMKKVFDFQNGKFKRFLVSINAGGAGLDLQVASYAIDAELPHSYAQFEQLCDRVHRIGSKKRVIIYKVIAPGSLDDYMNKNIFIKEEAADLAGVKT